MLYKGSNMYTQICTFLQLASYVLRFLHVHGAYDAVDLCLKVNVSSQNPQTDARTFSWNIWILILRHR